MKLSVKVICFLCFLFSTVNCFPQTEIKSHEKDADEIKPGAEQTTEYLPFIKGKTIAIVANQTSIIHHTHLVDSLVTLHQKIKCVFAPEHGFRGHSAAGKNVV